MGPEGQSPRSTDREFGKTTLALHVLANCQRGVAAFVDAEHALDISYARKLGLDVDNLLVAQPDTGEQALEIVVMLVRSGAVDCIVVDSVAAWCRRLNRRRYGRQPRRPSRTTDEPGAAQTHGDGLESNCSPFSSTRSV